VAVLECDGRLERFLHGLPEDVGPNRVIAHDLRDPLPPELEGGFDVFFTDPPYTLAGLSLFVSRGVSALRPQVGKQGYVCFGHRSPDESAQVFGLLVQMGLAPVEVLPGFNSYDGAQLLAGSSQMIRTASTGALAPAVPGRFDGPLYTASRKGRG
jgi:predicted methyltransferase